MSENPYVTNDQNLQPNPYLPDPPGDAHPAASTELAIPAGAELAPVHAAAPGTAEAAVLPSTEVDRLPDAEVALPGEEPDWFMPDRSLIKRPMEGIFLGAIVNEGGWGSKYHDDYDAPTEDGFVFGVSQSSAGFTGIYATAAQGYKVEALTHDRETGLPVWKGDDTGTGRRTLVTGDWGVMVDPDFGGEEDWKRGMRDGFGHPGGQVGVIRVTGPDGTVQHFVLGADFQGREDNWRVTGNYVPVQARNPEALEGLSSNGERVEAARAAIEAAKPQPRFEDDYYIDYSGNRISPDPLAEKRAEVRGRAEGLIGSLNRENVDRLVASGQVVERTDQWRQRQGLRLYRFAEPLTMPDGRQATMELELPVDDRPDARPHLNLKMAWDEGLRSGDRGYTVLDVYVFPPDDRFPTTRVVPSVHAGRGGFHSNSGLNQHHSNSMYSEVSTVGTAVADAERLIGRLMGAGQQPAVA